MNHTIDQPSLQELGEHLTVAIERDLRRTSRRPMRRVALIVAILAIVGTGTAAAAGLFTPRQVAAGMPAGAAIFDQTDPTCVLNDKTGAYRCTLSSAPAPEVSDFRGTKEVLAVGGKAAGGCIGLDAAGMLWDCYVGQAAVDHEIISQDFLGEPVFGPGVG
jgi:hypothetical protein